MYILFMELVITELLLIKFKRSFLRVYTWGVTIKYNRTEEFIFPICEIRKYFEDNDIKVVYTHCHVQWTVHSRKYGLF